MRLIIDTDTAGDDCFSILVAAAAPHATIEAVTICNGNIAFLQQVENALKTLEVAGLGGKVPVYPGCARPLLRAHVDAMIEIIMGSPGEITMIAQAPLTNIALAAAKEPRIAGALKHLWIMGGTDNGVGNVTPAAEYNFYVDPEAAAMVFAAGFKISLVTWTLSLTASAMSEADLAEVAAMGTERSDFFTTVNATSVQFSRDHYGHGGTLHPDALTAACALNEALVTDSDDCLVQIETGTIITRAYSSISHAQVPKQEIADPALGKAKKPNARVIKAVDAEGFRRTLKAALG